LNILREADYRQGMNDAAPTPVLLFAYRNELLALTTRRPNSTQWQKQACGMSRLIGLSRRGILSTIAVALLGPGFIPPAIITAQDQSQNAQSALPEFEVASVHRSSPKQFLLNGFDTYPGGRIVARGSRVEYLIMVAFNVQEYQIAGAPVWASLVTGDAFDIEAKPSDSSVSAHWNPAYTRLPPGDEERQMLQSLLADRFHLRVHREVKEGPVYLLTRGKGDYKLVPPRDKNGYPWAGGISGGWFGGGMQGQNISMSYLAERLSRFLKHPVHNQTGIEGSYDFEFRTGNDDNDSDIPGFLIRAMKGIGLELKSGRGLIETVVIDHVEQPSEN
jgi:uncharacterized protein (TIGR03435 family)